MFFFFFFKVSSPASDFNSSPWADCQDSGRVVKG